MKDLPNFWLVSIIVNAENNNCRPAPIFDNGKSLLSDWDRFHKDTVEENIEKVTGQSFSVYLEYQANISGIGLKIDYPKLKQK